MKNIYIAILTLLIILSACTKLDEEVYDKIPGDVYPENENQIANLSVGAYAKLGDIIDDAGWWYLAQEISSDELAAPTRGSDWFDGGKWADMHTHDWTNDTEGVNNMWSSFWTGITTCNQTLDMMNDLPQNEALAKKQSELKVLRSFFYYLLMDNYGSVPYLTSALNAPDQPLLEKKEVIYQSLIETVTNALPNLKAIDNKYMATRYMGYALLAKLYINAEVYTGTPQWALAGQYCDSIIDGPYTLATNVLEPFKVENSNSSEIIFSIPFDEDNFEGFRIHMRSLHYQQNLEFDMPVGPWNGFAVVPTFFDTYEVGDVRREAYHLFGQRYATTGAVIIDGETGDPLDINPHLYALAMITPDYTPYQLRTSGARVGKYEIKTGTKENLSNDFPLFRLTDFYLMKAEAEIHLGGNGDMWVNEIRSRAGVTNWSGTTLEQLLAERGRELYCEGHRRQDQIRFGKWNQSWWEKSSHGDDKNTFPIPKWATDVNPNLLIPAI